MALNYLRSILFYIVYAVSLVVFGCICMLVIWAFPIKSRYTFIVLWNRFAVWWLKICCGVSYRIQYQGAIPSGAFVMASNHQSPWETIFLYFMFQPLCATLKIELLSIPFFGWSLRLLQPIAIDRSKPREARTTLLTQGIERLKDGISVLIFPEGTRVDPGQEKKYSAGAAELAIAAGVSIIPLAHNAGKFWPAHQLIKNPGVIDVIVGSPIASVGREPKELIGEIQNWTRQSLSNLP